MLTFLTVPRWASGCSARAVIAGQLLRWGWEALPVVSAEGCEAPALSPAWSPRAQLDRAPFATKSRLGVLQQHGPRKLVFRAEHRTEGSF